MKLGPTYEERLRHLFDELGVAAKLAQRNEQFSFAQSLHHCRLDCSSALARLEKERRRRVQEQLSLLDGRVGRRHDGGDAA